MKKRIITYMLVLAVMVGIMLPMTASATTVNDVYDYFLTMPMAENYKADAQKLMKIVSVTDDQAAQLLDYLKKINTIADPAKGNDPRNYTAAEVSQVLNWVKEACAVVGVEVVIVTKADADRVSSVDEVVLEFYYKGQKIYEYDGDAVSKTGSDISMATLFGGFALLSAAAVAVVVFRKKETA